MKNSFTRRFFRARDDKPQGCMLIDRITTLAQSSADLDVALRCAADEIGGTLRLERSAILLFHESGTRLAGTKATVCFWASKLKLYLGGRQTLALVASRCS